MISTNFISFSVLNKSILMRGVVALLLLVSFGLFNVATAEAGTLPGYDVHNPKLDPYNPDITGLKVQYNFGLQPNNFNSVAITATTDSYSNLSYSDKLKLGVTGSSYKINNTIIDIHPKPTYKFDSGRIELTTANGFKAGDNEISYRICNFEGCSEWSNPKSITISKNDLGSKICDPKTSNTTCHTNTISTTGQVVDGKIYPYYYTLLNDPLNSELRKPNIVSSNVPDSIRIGATLNRFWDWVLVDSDLVNRYQIKVNDRISETYTDAIWNVSGVASVIQANGFKIGDNKVSVRQCNYKGCSPWSNEVNINVNDFEGRLASSNCSNYLANAVMAGNHVVKAKSSGTLFNNGSFFSTDSDLGALATYLGAPIGSIVQLSFSTINTNKDRCGNNYPSTTKNGITTTEYLNQSAYKLNMKVGMTVLCTGSDCAYSGQDYSHVPSSGGTTSTTNTGNTTTGTSNTTGTGTTGNTLGISGDLSSMSYTELLNLLKTLTDYLNNLISSAGGTNVDTNTNTNTTTNTGSTTGACLGDPAPASQTVTANNSPFKFVYGTGPFTTGSDLGKIAAYLGAPVGSEAHLQITDIGCIKNYNYTVQNGVTSIGWPAEWHGMNVVCTSGCTGGSSVSNDTSEDGGFSSNSVEINNNISVYNEPLNTKFPKPKINGSGGNTTQDVYFGQSISLFWAWSIPLSISYDSYQIKVNSTITEYDANSPAFSSKVTNLYVNDLIGFRVADDNKLSVRVCDVNGCSQWSDPMTIDVWLGWTKNMCSSSPIGLSIKVRVNNEGVIYGSGTTNSPFTTDSDLGTIAAFMGNKIGDVVTMNTDHNSMCMSTNDDVEVTKNGITTTPYNVNVKDQKRTMLVQCVEGCTN